jgi:glucokinase
MKQALAFDIGGTKIYSAIVDETGKIISNIEKFSTPKTLEGIKDLLKTQITKHENNVDIIAIATAGAVNNENTAVLGSTGNLVEGYSSIDFQSLSTKPVFLENDANSAAWAEYRIGASQNTNVSILLTLGTGVGGGIIIENKLLKLIYVYMGEGCHLCIRLLMRHLLEPLNLFLLRRFLLRF